MASRRESDPGATARDARRRQQSADLGAGVAVKPIAERGSDRTSRCRNRHRLMDPCPLSRVPIATPGLYRRLVADGLASAVAPPARTGCPPVWTRPFMYENESQARLTVPVHPVGWVRMSPGSSFVPLYSPRRETRCSPPGRTLPYRPDHTPAGIRHRGRPPGPVFMERHPAADAGGRQTLLPSQLPHRCPDLRRSGHRWPVGGQVTG